MSENVKHSSKSEVIQIETKWSSNRDYGNLGLYLDGGPCRPFGQTAGEGPNCHTETTCSSSRIVLQRVEDKSQLNEGPRESQRASDLDPGCPSRSNHEGQGKKAKYCRRPPGQARGPRTGARWQQSREGPSTARIEKPAGEKTAGPGGWAVSPNGQQRCPPGAPGGPAKTSETRCLRQLLRAARKPPRASVSSPGLLRVIERALPPWRA